MSNLRSPEEIKEIRNAYWKARNADYNAWSERVLMPWQEKAYTYEMVNGLFGPYRAAVGIKDQKLVEAGPPKFIEFRKRPKETSYRSIDYYAGRRYIVHVTGDILLYEQRSTAYKYDPNFEDIGYGAFYELIGQFPGTDAMLEFIGKFDDGQYPELVKRKQNADL